MEAIKARLFCYKTRSITNLWDVGNDPYFHSKPFSLGICRPNIRGSIKNGTRLFFYTKNASKGDYYLTGMMKVKKKLTQKEAANRSDLYCGHEVETCPYSNIDKYKRDCRCNIIVDRTGKYKEFCDGGKHKEKLEDYKDEKIYFVSTVEDSVATKKPVHLLDYFAITPELSRRWRFQGIPLENDIADKIEKVLRKASS